ncbi:MAG: Ribosomal protein L11 methyltransferase [Accumulibacter sp.]|jgi:ribosomal protein L11 methyltransferase|uniref:50S ribosomal protein L11 methyltransferase n=1 Tax=Accumulibacter sp. TaxID=2053492 RepID=UPI001211A4F6|nr:50S ribosomal protein L11 methyltransferase [Accumulibacter sp.]QKS27762.1 MAG: 50S ribosomal protein L11 methyltransferase [Candidatus Accumulibacter similis]TLD44140.1 MAG: Ribosomal protein L11 methyltransferase [Accumulibacter sp.]
MAWLSLSIRTDCQHAERLADALLEAGAIAASIEDADAGTADEQPQFGEPGSFSRPGWERSLVVALLRSDSDVRQVLLHCAAQAGLADPPPFSQEEVPEQDWVRLTQTQFEPIRVSQRLWIVPSWHAPPDPGAIVLVLDPGMAFGTGSHPTTRLCLEWLERSVRPGASLLDYGCGSGVLAIAAGRLGASEVVGVDIDPQAVAVARENAVANGVVARFQESADQLDGQFDIVVANILANPLRVLAPALCSHLRPGSLLALSGILVEQSDDLIEAYAPYLSLAVVDTREGWVCLAGSRN